MPIPAVFDARLSQQRVPAKQGRIYAFALKGVLHLTASCGSLHLYFVWQQSARQMHPRPYAFKGNLQKLLTTSPRDQLMIYLVLCCWEPLKADSVPTWADWAGQGSKDTLDMPILHLSIACLP